VEGTWGGGGPRAGPHPLQATLRQLYRQLYAPRGTLFRAVSSPESTFGPLRQVGARASHTHTRTGGAAHQEHAPVGVPQRGAKLQGEDDRLFAQARRAHAASAPHRHGPAAARLFSLPLLSLSLSLSFSLSLPTSLSLPLSLPLSLSLTPLALSLRHVSVARVLYKPSDAAFWTKQFGLVNPNPNPNPSAPQRTPNAPGLLVANRDFRVSGGR
jgi:hypothetical protein